MSGDERGELGLFSLSVVCLIVILTTNTDYTLKSNGYMYERLGRKDLAWEHPCITIASLRIGTPLKVCAS